MKVLEIGQDKIGIMSLEDYKKRTIAITKGEYHPEPDEPKMWCASLEEFERIKKEIKEKNISLAEYFKGCPG